ncbi:MAG: PPC domain-containing protein, partial [Anaerolineales bacterium]
MMRQLSILALCVAWLSGAAFAGPVAQTPPRPINIGQPVEGELNDVQRALQYVFEAEAGQNITLLMQTTSGDLDAFLSLATFEGEPLAEDDNSGNGSDALIQFTVAQSGAYVVTAGRSPTAAGGGAGAFTLSLSAGQLEIDTPELEVGPRMQPIVRGTPVQGALTTDARFVLYWFEGQADENLVAAPDPGTSLQPLLVLYDARFTELTRNAPGGALSAELPADDLYFLAVALPDALSQPGNYALTLSAADDAATIAATPEPREVSPGQNRITYNESVRGIINNTVAVYTFQFSGSAGDDISITMSRAGGDLDSYLFLLDSGGVTLAEDDDSVGSNGDARIETTLPTDGDYLILATRRGQDSGTSMGNFLLSLTSDAAPVPTAPAEDTAETAPDLREIAFGETASGQVSDLNVLSPYRFRARAGDEIVITMSAQNGLDPYLVLLRANQEPLAENDDYQPNVNRDAQITYTIPDDGAYIIVATRFEQAEGNTSGAYDLTLRRAGQEVISVEGEGETAGFVQRLD